MSVSFRNICFVYSSTHSIFLFILIEDHSIA